MLHNSPIKRLTLWAERLNSSFGEGFFWSCKNYRNAIILKWSQINIVGTEQNLVSSSFNSRPHTSSRNIFLMHISHNALLRANL